MTVEHIADILPDALAALNDAAQRPEPKRDRWGRYVIPHPHTGKEHSWTRATTWAKSCADTFGLTKWELRMTTFGLARRPDLLAQAATVVDPDDRAAKRLLNDVADAAKEAAGASVRRNLGTALHSFTEQVDAGGDPVIPEAYWADFAAYRQATAGLAIDPGHIERIVTLPDLSVAGTFDRLVTYDGRLLITDLKTGRDLSYSWGDIAIQLALYAHGETIYDPATDTHEPMPEVDRTVGLVVHLPVGEGTCTLYHVDLVAGWEMAQVCGHVRAWRKRKNLASPVVTDTLLEPPDWGPDQAARTAWITDRMATLAGDPSARQQVARAWPEGVPTPKVGGWTDAHIDLIDAALSSVEQQLGTPFHPGDPAVITAMAAEATREPDVAIERAPAWRLLDDGDPVSADTVQALRDTVAGLDDRQSAQLGQWARDAVTQRRPWASSDVTERTHAIALAAIACVRHMHDDDEPDGLTRAALGEVIGEDLHPTWRTGAVLGSLSIDEAQRLARLVARFVAGTDTTVAAISARVAAMPAA